jgi:tellurite resistance protein
MSLFQPVELDPAASEAMARGLLAVAHSDGFHDSEAHFLAACLYQGRPEGGDAWIRSLSAAGPIAPAELAEALPRAENRRTFLDLARSLAYVDGVISAQEQAAIEKYAVELGVSEVDLKRLGDSLLAGHASHPLAAALPESVRSESADIYRSYLRERNGELDRQARTLSARDAWFREIETTPVRWPDPINREAFERNRSSFRDADLEPLLLFLLVTVKLNRVERYAADLAEATGRIDKGGPDSPDAWINTEELYHTRILEHIARCFGIELEIDPPALSQRLVVRSMLNLPKRATLPLVLAGELAAVVAFRMLLDHAAVLLAPHPLVRERVQTLLSQILTDELGHVAYCRSQLGPAGIRTARLLLPVVLGGMMSDFRELPALLGKGAIERGIEAFDLDDIRRHCAVAPFWIECAPEEAIPVV